MKWNFLLSLLVGVLSWIVGVDASHHHSQKVFIDDAQPYFITESSSFSPLSTVILYLRKPISPD